MIQKSLKYIAVDVYCRVNAADVAEYFPYPRVINFLFEFCEKLFGISVKVSCFLFLLFICMSETTVFFMELMLMVMLLSVLTYCEWIIFLSVCHVDC